MSKKLTKLKKLRKQKYTQLKRHDCLYYVYANIRNNNENCNEKLKTLINLYSFAEKCYFPNLGKKTPKYCNKLIPIYLPIIDEDIGELVIVGEIILSVLYSYRNKNYAILQSEMEKICGKSQNEKTQNFNNYLHLLKQINYENHFKTINECEIVNAEKLKEIMYIKNDNDKKQKKFAEINKIDMEDITKFCSCYCYNNEEELIINEKIHLLWIITPDENNFHSYEMEELFEDLTRTTTKEEMHKIGKNLYSYTNYSYDLSEITKRLAELKKNYNFM
jgi:hypothetical protein